MRDLELMRSFRPLGDYDFEAVSPSGERISPVYAVASIALRRVVDGATLARPEGYTDEVLNNVLWMSGYVEKPMCVSGRQGVELRDMGVQLLELDKAQQIQPPLKWFETEAIERLVYVVTEAESRLSA